MLCVALFSERSLLESYLFRNEVKMAPDVGLVFGGSGKLLLTQLLGVLVIVAWTAAVTGTLMNLLRVCSCMHTALNNVNLRPHRPPCVGGEACIRTHCVIQAAQRVKEP